MYNHKAAFETNGFIDWNQTRNFNVGDYVYIYCSKGISRIQYLTIVEKINIPFNEKYDDGKFWLVKEIPKKKKYMRLRLLRVCENDNLSLINLRNNGMKYAPQSPCVLNDELDRYLLKYFGGANGLQEKIN